jgi:hypothetical protein
VCILANGGHDSIEKDVVQKNAAPQIRPLACFTRSEPGEDLLAVVVSGSSASRVGRCFLALGAGRQNYNRKPILRERSNYP